ncbi:MAG: hypothetical protein WA840_19230 [Caulobacteraceae bacterium]
MIRRIRRQLRDMFGKRWRFRRGPAGSTSWHDIAFVLDEQIAAEAAAAWSWLIPEPWKVVLCSKFGGIFLEKATGGVFWLECGTGLVEQVADSAEEFHAYLGSQRVGRPWRPTIEEWFLPELVRRLHEAGKKPGPGECFALIFPLTFQEGRYEVGNICVAPVREWLVGMADIHHQMLDVPHGAAVQIKVVD